MECCETRQIFLHVGININIISSRSFIIFLNNHPESMSMRGDEKKFGIISSE